MLKFTTPRKARTYTSGYFCDKPPVQKALNLLYQHHNGLRKDGVTPEWFHQLSILMYLMTMENSFRDYKYALGPGSWEGTTTYGHFPTHLYVSALLHDLHEDYGYPIERLKDGFGTHVAGSVERLSKKGPGFAKTLPDYYKSMETDPIASIVKGADRIHNVQTMPGVFKTEKMRAYLAETEEYVLPMLKSARKNFPDLRPVYENIKHVLVTQGSLIRFFLEAQDG